MSARVNSHTAFIYCSVNGDLQAFKMDAEGRHKPTLLARLDVMPGIMTLCEQP